MSNEPVGMLTSLRTAFLDPVRFGTLNLKGRSTQTAGITIGIAVLFALIIVAIILANPLRATAVLIAAPGETEVLVIPEYLIPVVLALLGVSAALALTGAVRCSPLFALPLVAVSTLVLTAIVASSVNSLADPQLTIAAFALLGIAVALFIGARLRPGGVARDFLIFLVPLMASMALAQRGFTDIAAASGIRVDVVTVALALSFIAALALPIAIMSGFSAVDVGVGLVSGFAHGLGAMIHDRLMRVAIAVVILIQIVLTISDLRDSSVRQHLLIAAATALACVLVWSLLRIRSTREGAARGEAALLVAPTAYGLSFTVILGGVIGMVGLVLGLTLVPGASATLQPVVTGFLESPGPWLNRFAVIIGLVVFSATSRRSRPLLAGVAGVGALLLAGNSFAEAGVSWSPQAFADVAFIGVCAWFLRETWSRRGRWMEVSGPAFLALALTFLLRQPDFLALPFTVVIGGSATAVIVVGLVWSFLTDGADPPRPSRRLGGDARLLLLLASFLFGATVVAWATIGRQPLLSEALGQATTLGVQSIGTALVVCVLLTLITGAARKG